MKVAVLGRTRMLAVTARELHANGHEVVLVIAPSGPRHQADAEPLNQIAAEIGCPFLAVSNLESPDVLSAIEACGAEVGVSVNWPTLVPPRALDAFRHGVLNAHAGDLPRYRGNATLGWAILNDETEIVVTVHRMDPGLDSGPVFAKQSHPIDASTYVGDLFDFCDLIVPKMFSAVLTNLTVGLEPPRPQDQRPEVGLRCFPRTPADGWLEWSRDAESLARIVRASSQPLDGAYTLLGHERLTIWRAHHELLHYEHQGVPGQVIEIRRDSGEVMVLAGSGALVLELVQQQGQTAVSAAEALSSTRQRLGFHLPTVVEDLLRRVAELERQAPQERPQ